MVIEMEMDPLALISSAIDTVEEVMETVDEIHYKELEAVVEDLRIALRILEGE